MAWLGSIPFFLLLACAAALPLLPATRHAWERNRTKLFVGLALAAPVLLFYLLRPEGCHTLHGTSAPGLPSLLLVLRHALAEEYAPFIILLLALYTISGGIHLSGDIPAHPLTNTLILALGAVLASCIGTTGAAMLLIRPLLRINSERRHVRHTVVFFIFLVANIGGLLLPIGDPPLFLGYLLGVPFLWTLRLWKVWLFCVVVLLAVYWVWDSIAWRSEARGDIARDEAVREPLVLLGRVNLLLLPAAVIAAGMIDPSKPLPWVDFRPFPFLREAVLLALAGASLWLTPGAARRAHGFNFAPMAEVAALFLGIFLTMQAPVELLNLHGARLGLEKPWQFFWASGMLSSVLDNAPTYVVFFSAACALPAGPDGLGVSLGNISPALLSAISCGSVFFGALTYIGNGPNILVQSVAGQAGVKMPSFGGYVVYSVLILLPLFLVAGWVFF